MILLLGPAAFGAPLLVDFLDIGQGDAIVVRHGEHTMLVDAGDRGRDLIDQLRLLDVDRLEVVVATHPHADHIGGMPEVLETYAIDRWLDNGMPHTTELARAVDHAVDARGIDRIPARAGQIWAWGDCVFTVLFPTPNLLLDTRSDLNANSVVLRIDHGPTSVLLTGDSEDPTERMLLREGLSDVDVLKVAHHGSGHSTSSAWLRALDPEFAVISVGASNRYGHPDPETLQRLDDAGAMIFRTDESHTVRLWSDGDQLEFFEGPLADLGPGTYRYLVGVENAPDPRAPPPGPKPAPPAAKTYKWPCSLFHKKRR